MSFCSGLQFLLARQAKGSTFFHPLQKRDLYLPHAFQKQAKCRSAHALTEATKVWAHAGRPSEGRHTSQLLDAGVVEALQVVPSIQVPTKNTVYKPSSTFLHDGRAWL